MHKRALIFSALSFSLIATLACERQPPETSPTSAQQGDDSAEAVATNEGQRQAEAALPSAGSDETSAHHEPVIVDERSAERTEGRITLLVGERELRFEPCAVSSHPARASHPLSLLRWPVVIDDTIYATDGERALIAMELDLSDAGCVISTKTDFGEEGRIARTEDYRRFLNVFRAGDELLTLLLGGGLAPVSDQGVGEVFCEDAAFDRASALSDGTIITEASNVVAALNRDDCSTEPRFPGFTKVEAIDGSYTLGRLQSGDYTVESRPTHDEILWTFGGPMGDVAWLAQPNGLVVGEELIWVIDGNGRKMHAIDTDGRHLAAVDYYRLVERRTSYAMGAAMLEDGSALLFFGGREGDTDDGAAELQVWRLRGL